MVTEVPAPISVVANPRATLSELPPLNSMEEVPVVFTLISEIPLAPSKISFALSDRVRLFPPLVREQ